MQPIGNLLLTPPRNPENKAEVTTAENDFAKMLTGLVGDVAEQQKAADTAIRQIHTGGEKNLPDAMIAMEQADISMRFMVQVRNKALDAYQEIMRMQV